MADPILNADEGDRLDGVITTYKDLSEDDRVEGVLFVSLQRKVNRWNPGPGDPPSLAEKDLLTDMLDWCSDSPDYKSRPDWDLDAFTALEHKVNGFEPVD